MKLLVSGETCLRSPLAPEGESARRELRAGVPLGNKRVSEGFYRRGIYCEGSLVVFVVEDFEGV